MKISKHVILSSALVALAAGCLTGPAMAQDAQQQQAKPMFAKLPPHNTYHFTTPPTPSTLTVFSNFYGNHVHYTMVGMDPSVSSADYNVTVPTFIVPLIISVNGMTFDPSHNLGSQTVIQNAAGSPIFKNANWNLSPEHLRHRQYIDAYQKGSLWGLGAATESSYHVRLDAPTVLPSVTITCSSPQCSTSINPITGQGTVALVDINLIDSTIQQTINSNPTITPGALPTFLTYDTYLTSGGCCIGGYHSAYGGIGSQTYQHTTWIDPIVCSGLCQFSEDVAAFSHETGEWIEDPYTSNSGCGGLLEVGDPLVQHDYVQKLNGFNYHVQDLVFFAYFYANPSNSINAWYSFRNEPLSVCSNGQ